MTDYLIYALFISLEKTVPFFPLNFVRLLARFYGNAFYYLIPVRKKVALGNLKLAFPEKNSAELKSILKSAYANIFTVIFEFFYFKKLNDEKLKEILKVTNLEIIGEKLKQRKGLILVGAHFGNWELAAFGISQLCGEPFNVIVKEQSNKRIDTRINKIREFRGNKMINMEHGVRDVISALRRNKIVAMLSDQYAPGEDTVKVKFFVDNVPAYGGAARIAFHTGAAVLFGVPVREKDGSYSISLREIDILPPAPLRGREVEREESEENIKRLTQGYTDLLAEYIRKYPEQWLWFHRRFKNIKVLGS